MHSYGPYIKRGYIGDKVWCSALLWYCRQEEEDFADVLHLPSAVRLYAWPVLSVFWTGICTSYKKYTVIRKRSGIQGYTVLNQCSFTLIYDDIALFTRVFSSMSLYPPVHHDFYRDIFCLGP